MNKPLHDSRPPVDPDTPAADPVLQGEGNYTATRRHRASVKKFVDAGKVEPAARDAAPDTAEEVQSLEAAERVGRSHARR